MANRDDLREKFELFDASNPWIYDRFCEMCAMLIDRGFARASSTMLIESLKMEYAIKHGGELHVPNNHRAYYAQKWQASHKTPYKFFKIVASRSAIAHKFKTQGVENGKAKKLEIGHAR